MLNRGKDNYDDSGFESFRKERNKRRLTSGQAFRPAAQHSDVLQELEEREASEVRNQQMNREVADFFADATRTAANIVAKVSESEEKRHDESVGDEMTEFLRDAIRRAQDLITIIHADATGDEGRTELNADVHNLVGAKLDEFRYEGTAQLEDKHIGLDPFAVELAEIVAQAPGIETPPETTDEMTVETTDATTDETTDETATETTTEQPEVVTESTAEPVGEIEDHLIAEVVAEGGTVAQVPSPQSALTSGDLFARLAAADVQRLKECLKLLVRSAMMTKDEALKVFRSVAR